MRAAARWTIAAFGAIGAALIGGGPLVAVGRIHGFGDALIAGAALLAVLAGVSIAIWKVTQVLIPPVTTPASLTGPETRDLREMIDAAPADFFGGVATGVDDLLRHRMIAVNVNRALMGETDPRRRADLQRHLRRANANLARTDPYVRWLLAMAHVWQIRAALHDARRWCLLAMVIVAAGAVAFLTITGRSHPDQPRPKTLPAKIAAATPSSPIR
ncbi:Conserved putative membrane protein [Actinomadura verrucosospora]|uniref:Conserved putative membrane protein n=1 Tax=Actinomadura verrucosospora TaxID=46165 RepID=A0A7D3VUH8_ACTVE|nr:Conserved putative membrane protein [Actinomadura verrucosospora]